MDLNSRATFVDRIKLICAAVFVFVGVSVGFVVLLPLLQGYPPWVTSLPMAVLGLVFVGLARRLFGGKQSPPGVEAETLRRLALDGLLVCEIFRARRAFRVEEFEDEGSHYYVELDDGRVLFLSGQYLYDCEPELDGKAVVRPRLFPCTEFAVWRHRQQHYVVYMICGGIVLEPEFVAPHFVTSDFDLDDFPSDGDIVSGRPYDSLKADRSRPQPRWNTS